MIDEVSQNNRGYFAWIPLAIAQPPSMTIAEKDKGEVYHATWTRYFLSQQMSQWVNYYRSNFFTNASYSIDALFGEEADLRMYLGDGPAQTSRIPFKFPIMSPTLTRMIGAVDNISIDAKAETATQHLANDRKRAALQERLMMSDVAAAGPAMAQAYAPMGISPDPQQTEQFFDMSYDDHIKRGANSLMTMLSERNNLKETKRIVAMNMAVSGMAAFHNFINGSNIETEVVDPREVGWDTSAIKPDMSDGRYTFVAPLMDVGAIAERWNPKADIIRSLDYWARMLPNGVNYNSGWPQSRPRVFNVYWKDYKKVERGYVIKDGQPEYCTINEPNPDTGVPDYTDADLIEPPMNRYTRAWTPAELRNKKQERYVVVVRYCSMIPWEYLPGGYTKGAAYSQNLKPTKPEGQLPFVGVAGDIVFDYGEYPLQEADPDDVYSVKFPIKISTWRYLNGHVVAPLTAIRDPQRWMNQLTSEVAYRLRVAGGKLVTVATEAITDSNYDEQQLEMKMKEGGVAILSASALGGLPQATGVIDSSPSSSFYQMVGLLPTVKGIAESATGVYDQNFGAPQGPDQLVGTMQLQLQQAGVMQQPFYASIADLFKQQMQFYAQAGKQFYSRMPWLLEQMAGEDMPYLVSSKDMQLEQFRVTVETTQDSKQLRLITDQQLIPGLMQLGMLDPVTAAQLMGRSIPDDVYAAARQFTKQAAAAAAEQAAMQQQAQQQQAMALEQAAIRDEEADIAKQMTDAQLQSQAMDVKKNAPFNQALSEHLKPVEDPSMAQSTI